MDQPFVDFKIKQNIGIISFFHPGHNALPSILLSQLSDKLTEADKDENVKVILLKSAGDRTFCAGANFDELLAIRDLASGKAFFSGFGNLINRIRTVKKLVIGRVQGKAVGGGVGLAAACDICFATKFASVRLSEISIGIGPFVIEPAVSRKIGKNMFSKLSLQPLHWVDAHEAHGMGLYAQVFDDSDTMDTFLNEYLGQLASYNPNALTEMKEILWAGTEHWDELLDQRAALSGKLVLSEFTRKALNKIKKA